MQLPLWLCALLPAISTSILYLSYPYLVLCCLDRIKPKHDHLEVARADVMAVLEHTELDLVNETTSLLLTCVD